MADKKDDIVSQVTPKFDFKMIGVAALLSGGLGIGGGLLGNSGEDSQFILLQKEIRGAVAIIEQRSEKRYRRGMAFGEKMELRGINLEAQFQDLRVKVAKLEEAKKCQCE